MYCPVPCDRCGEPIELDEALRNGGYCGDCLEELDWLAFDDLDWDEEE